MFLLVCMLTLHGGGECPPTKGLQRHLDLSLPSDFPDSSEGVRTVVVGALEFECFWKIAVMFEERKPRASAHWLCLMMMHMNTLMSDPHLICS